MSKEAQRRMAASNKYEKAHRIFALLANEVNQEILQILSHGEAQTFTQVRQDVQHKIGVIISYSDLNTRINVLHIAGLVTMTQGVKRGRKGKHSDAPVSSVQINPEVWQHYEWLADQAETYFKA